LPDDYSTHGRSLLDTWTDEIGSKLLRAEVPEAGDIGVVLLVTAQGRYEMGGIFTGQKWAIVTPDGLSIVRLRPSNVLGVWRRG
jgi:hypothetical protein